MIEHYVSVLEGNSPMYDHIVIFSPPETFKNAQRYVLRCCQGKVSIWQHSGNYTLSTLSFN